MPFYRGSHAASELCCYGRNPHFSDHLTTLQKYPKFWYHLTRRAAMGTWVQPLCHGMCPGGWQGSVLSPGNPGPALRTCLVCLDSWSPSSQEGVGPCSVCFGETETSAVHVDVHKTDVPLVSKGTCSAAQGQPRTVAAT